MVPLLFRDMDRPFFGGRMIPPKKLTETTMGITFWTNCALVTGNCKTDLQPTLFYKVGPLPVRNGAKIHINGLTWTFKSGCHEKTLRNGELTPLNGTIWHPFEGCWYKWVFIRIISPLQVELWVTFNWWQGPNRSNENHFMRIVCFPEYVYIRYVYVLHFQTK